MRAKKWKGKVPFTWVRSIPFSAANFFARGLTTTLPPLRGGPAEGAAGAGAAAGWGGGGGAAAGVAITLTKNQSLSGTHSKRIGPSNYQSRDNDSCAQRLPEIKSETHWEGGQLNKKPNKIKNLSSPFPRMRNQNWHKQQAGRKSE